MPIADRIQGLTGQISRHRDRMSRIAERKMDFQIENRRLDRQAGIDAENKELRDIKKRAAKRDEVAALEEIANGNKDFTLNLGKSTSMSDATWKADRILEATKDMSTDLGEEITYDPNTKRFLRSARTDMETGLMYGIALTNREVKPLFDKIMSITALNTSRKRYLEAKVEDPNADPRFQARLDKYNKNEIGELEDELTRKKRMFSQVSFQYKGEQLKHAKSGIAKTDRDLKAAKEKATKVAAAEAAEAKRVQILLEKRKYNESQKKSLKEQATEASLKSRVVEAQKALAGAKEFGTPEEIKAAEAAYTQAFADIDAYEKGGKAEPPPNIRDGKIHKSPIDGKSYWWDPNTKNPKTGKMGVFWPEGKGKPTKKPKGKQPPKKKVKPRKSKFHKIPKMLTEEQILGGKPRPKPIHEPGKAQVIHPIRAIKKRLTETNKQYEERKKKAAEEYKRRVAAGKR